MRPVTFSFGASLDGYVVGPDGEFGWTAPDEELFAFVLEEFQSVGAHLMGRRLYETMLHWEDPERQAAFSPLEREWAATWNPLPKVVFSRTLSSVRGQARLADGDVGDEIARLQAEPGSGSIAIGGPTLAHQAFSLGLVDEIRIRVHPVLIGGGLPLFPREEQHLDLELVTSRPFPSGVIALHYLVCR